MAGLRALPLWAALLLVVLPLLAQGGARSSVHIDGDVAHLTLIFPQPAQHTRRDRGRDRVFAFDQPLDLPTGTLANQLGPWLESIWGGYDALLLRPREGVAMQVEQTGRELRIRLDKAATRPAARVETEAEPEDPGQLLRLERLGAVYRMENGDLLGAARRLRELIGAHPDLLQAHLDLADVEQRLGRWQAAIEHYQKALDLAPDNRDTIAAKTRLQQLHGPRLRLDTSIQHVSSAEDQWITRVDARLTPHARLNLDMVLEHRRMDTHDSNVTRLDGQSLPFDGTRQHMILDFGLFPGDQTRLRLSLTATGRQLGLGVGWQYTGNPGRTFLSLDWRRPWTGTLEAVAGYGSRDRIELRHEYTYRSRLHFTGGVSLNRYELYDLSRAAESIGFDFGVRYDLPFQAPGLSVGYSVDHETITHRAELRDPLGVQYRPLELLSHEIHSIDLAWSDRLTDYLRFDTRVGYGYDRINGDGPFLSLDLIYEPAPELESGLYLNGSNTTGRGADASLIQGGGYLEWRF